MNNSFHRGLGLVALLGAGAIAACNNQAPTVTPSPSPVASATVVPSPSPSPSVGFRDDFDGTAVDAARWKVFEQRGIAVVRNGRLEMLASGNQPNFPYLLSRESIIPRTGPFYFEMAYEYLGLATGTVSFSLDFLPGEEPGEEALTTPLVRSAGFYTDLRTTIKGRTYDVKSGVAVGKRQVLRVEHDGVKGYRMFVDGAEIAAFESTHRPTRFWIGSFPVKDVNPMTWPHVAVDYVAADVLTSPTPPSSPSPAPSPSASAR